MALLERFDYHAGCRKSFEPICVRDNQGGEKRFDFLGLGGSNEFQLPIGRQSSQRMVDAAAVSGRNSEKIELMHGPGGLPLVLMSRAVLQIPSCERILSNLLPLPVEESGNVPMGPAEQAGRKMFRSNGDGKKGS